MSAGEAWYVSPEDATACGQADGVGWYVNTPGSEHGVDPIGPFPCEDAALTSAPMVAALRGALPWLILLGNYIGNGVATDPTHTGVPVGPMGRCDAIAAVRAALGRVGA